MKQKTTVFLHLKRNKCLFEVRRTVRKGKKTKVKSGKKKTMKRGITSKRLEAESIRENRE
jgi:hypothetical protein